MPIAPPTVTADSVWAYNLDTGESYYEKDLTRVEYTASLIKCLTALVLLDNKNLSELQSETYTVVADDIVGGDTSGQLQSGDVITLYDLLGNLMIGSNNASGMSIAAALGAESLGGTPTHAASVAEFVSMMGAKATALGLGDTTVVTPHGLGTAGGNDTSTVVDCAVMFEACLGSSVIADFWRWRKWRFPVTGGRSTTLTTVGRAVMGTLGVLGHKGGTRGTDDVHNQFVWWEAPNGQRLVIGFLGSSSSANRDADYAAIVAELPVDFTELATPGTAWTPGYMFTDLTAGGDWWDPDDLSKMWQDDAKTVAVTAVTDPVRRWEGQLGNLEWFSTSDATRLTLRNNGSENYLEGAGSDWMTLGAGSFGNTNLLAAATESFMVGVRASTASDGLQGTVISKCSATGANRTFQQLFTQSASVSFDQRIRGALSSEPDEDEWNNGAFHNIVSIWDAADYGTAFDETGLGEKAVGTAADETTQNIMLLSRTQSSPAFTLAGFIGTVVLVDEADHDHWRRMKDHFNGGSVNAFADPTGGVAEVTSEKALHPIAHGSAAGVRGLHWIEEGF